MAIPEFQCRKCRRLFDKDQMSEVPKDALSCPYCGEQNPDRILSHSVCNPQGIGLVEDTKFT
jgi:putative FmdB family regulatory protein